MAVSVLAFGLIAGAMLGQARSAAQSGQAGEVLLTKVSPPYTLTVTTNTAGAGWFVRFQRDGAGTPQTVGPFFSGVRPADVNLLVRDQLAVRCDEGPNSSLSEVHIINLRSGREIEELETSYPSVSPDGRYLLFERVNRRFEEDQVGSVLLMYDVNKASAENRTRAADSRRLYQDTGIPVFPDYFRFQGVYTIPEDSVEGGGELISKNPVWADATRAVFGYRRNSKVSLVMLTLNEAGQMVQSSERPIDAVQYMKADPDAPASDRMRIENIAVTSVSNSTVSVRLTFGPTAQVRQPYLDLDLP